MANRIGTSFKLPPETLDGIAAHRAAAGNDRPSAADIIAAFVRGGDWPQALTTLAGIVGGETGKPTSGVEMLYQLAARGMRDVLAEHGDFPIDRPALNALATDDVPALFLKWGEALAHATGQKRADGRDPAFKFARLNNGAFIVIPAGWELALDGKSLLVPVTDDDVRRVFLDEGC